MSATKSRILLILFATSIVVLISVLLSRTEILFGQPEYSYSEAQLTFWGPMEDRVWMRVKVTNASFLPIWFVCDKNSEIAVGLCWTLTDSNSTVTTLEDDEYWKRLDPGESVTLKESFSFANDLDSQHGIMIKDFLGRQHAFHLE